MFPHMPCGNSLPGHPQCRLRNHVRAAFCQLMYLKPGLPYIVHTGITPLPTFIYGISSLDDGMFHILVINQRQDMLCQDRKSVV